MRNLSVRARIFFAFVALCLLGCIYGFATNLWTYMRLRAVPVDVVRSSLLIDIPRHTDSPYTYPDFILRLDLKTADGGDRVLHWEDAAGLAAYPEEAFDELARWAPGTRHTIYQIRGDAREIRLPGGPRLPEVNGISGYGFGIIFFGFAVVICVGMFAESNSRFDFPRLKQFAGVWLIFFSFGVLMAGGAVAFVISEVPRHFTWARMTAGVGPSITKYDPSTFPSNVHMTEAAQQKLESAPRRVLTTIWNGTPIHAVMGRMDGVYDGLSAVCGSFDSDTSCEFHMSPTNRWGVIGKYRWGGEFFVPLGMFTLFGTVFCGVGLMIKRDGRYGHSRWKRR